MQNQAAEVRLLAERRAGEVLREMSLRGGDRKSNRRNGTRLEDFGISQQESCRWQREASLPEEDFQEYVRLTKEWGKELTSSELLRLARVYTWETSARENLFRRMMSGLRKLAQKQSQFRCIHVIPPWPDGRTYKANVSCIGRELLDLPVQSVAAEKAHLHLWTPPEMLEEGLRLLRAWGFQYRTTDAVYDVYDNGTLLTPNGVTVSQEQSPGNDSPEANDRPWMLLGVWNVGAADTITITLVNHDTLLGTVLCAGDAMIHAIGRTVSIRQENVTVNSKVAPANDGDYADWVDACQPIQVPVDGQGDRMAFQLQASIDPLYTQIANIPNVSMSDWQAQLSIDPSDSGAGVVEFVHRRQGANPHRV